MAGGFPLGLEFCNLANYGATGATPYGVTLTPSATANTKGAWAQLTASCGQCDWMHVHLGMVAASATASIDIGTGAAASEVVRVTNLVIQGNSGTASSSDYYFPFYVPAGTRIAARASLTNTGATSVFASVIAAPSSMGTYGPAGPIDTIGWATGIGTAVVGANGSFGSYAQLIASTTNPYRGFFLGFDGQQQTETAAVLSSAVNIGVGAGGSEKIILPALAFAKLLVGSTVVILPGCSPYFAVSIPAGSRIAAQIAGDGAGAANLTSGITFYGIR